MFDTKEHHSDTTLVAELTSAGIVALVGAGTPFSDSGIGFGWDTIKFLHCALYEVMGWICAKNNLYSTLMGAGEGVMVSK